MEKLIALHRHWLTADAVKLTAGVPIKGSLDMDKDLLEFAQMQSFFLRIAVWYSLLYVVVEGYGKLALDDDSINELLRNEQMVDYLRRFRNAVFHYQGDPVGPKLMSFLEEKKSEVWIHQLHSAFKVFFESQYPIKEAMESLRAK